MGYQKRKAEQFANVNGFCLVERLADDLSPRNVREVLDLARRVNKVVCLSRTEAISAGAAFRKTRAIPVSGLDS